MSSVSSATDPSLYDWSAAGVFVNPHPLLHEMRARAPVYFDSGLEAWVLTRYRDVCQALRDPRFGRVEQLKRFRSLLAKDREALSPLRRVFPVWGGQGEPPADHALFVELLRPAMLGSRHERCENHDRLVSARPSAGVGPLVEAMRVRMRATLERLLDAAVERRQFDMVGEVARPFAMQAVADLLGVPTVGRMEMLSRCAQVVPGMFEQGTREQLYGCQECVLELRDYVEPFVAAHRAQSQPDLISLFLEAGEKHFDHEYVVAQTVLLLLVVGSYPPGTF